MGMRSLIGSVDRGCSNGSLIPVPAWKSASPSATSRESSKKLGSAMIQSNVSSVQPEFLD